MKMKDIELKLQELDELLKEPPKECSNGSPVGIMFRRRYKKVKAAIRELLSYKYDNNVTTPEEYIKQYMEWDKGLQEGFVTLDVALRAVQMAREQDSGDVWHDTSIKPIFTDDPSSNQILVFGETPAGKSLSVCSMIDSDTVYSPVTKKEYKWGACPFTKWTYADNIKNHIKG